VTAAGSVPATLLIVDDNQALCQLLAWEFEDKGYAVWLAADCGQAIASAGAMSFDFVLVDFHLPDGDGHSLSRRLKQLLPAAQIVMMSGDREAATAGRADTGGTRLFVEKPVPTARVHRIFSAAAEPVAPAVPCR
jgi:DNA-binding NtrC family response regulator